MTTSARPVRTLPILDMNLVLLGSITRHRDRGRRAGDASSPDPGDSAVVRHHEPRGAAIDVQDVDAARNRQRLRFVADAVSKPPARGCLKAPAWAGERASQGFR